jgi:hypothetical protein
MPESDINAAALKYWHLTRYTEEDIMNFCSRFDKKRLVALVRFSPGKPLHLSISTKCWEIQQGHYGTICKFFNEVATHPIGAQLDGPVIVWLDDGVHSYEYHSLKDAPILGFGRSIHDSYSFLIPDPAFMRSNGHEEDLAEQKVFEPHIPFSDRKETLFWRGAASGLGFDPEGWKISQRGCLTLTTKRIANKESFDALFTKVEGWPEDTCDSIKSEDITGPPIDFLDFLKYRYLIDADGICCAWISLYRKLASHSVTVKMQSENIQWYYNRLKPWIHYVPMRGDARDIEDVYKWLVSHPRECEQISKNANQLINSISYAQEIENTALLIKEILSFKIADKSS